MLYSSTNGTLKCRKGGLLLHEGCLPVQLLIMLPSTVWQFSMFCWDSAYINMCSEREVLQKELVEKEISTVSQQEKINSENQYRTGARNRWNEVV